MERRTDTAEFAVLRINFREINGMILAPFKEAHGKNDTAISEYRGFLGCFIRGLARISHKPVVRGRAWLRSAFFEAALRMVCHHGQVYRRSGVRYAYGRRVEEVFAENSPSSAHGSAGPVPQKKTSCSG
jgi:hypothetical protein